jgi:hypothetical protein
LYELVEIVNSHYGIVLFFFYVLNLTVSSCLIGAVVLGGYTSNWDLGVKLFGAAVFLLYSTGLFTSMVAATEEVRGLCCGKKRFCHFIEQEKVFFSNLTCNH